MQFLSYDTYIYCFKNIFVITEILPFVLIIIKIHNLKSENEEKGITISSMKAELDKKEERYQALEDEIGTLQFVIHICVKGLLLK